MTIEAPNRLRPASLQDFADGSTFQMGQPPERIDILQQIGVTFDEAWNNRIEGTFDEIPACIISREDMIRNKSASGREQDLLDVKVLRAAEKAVLAKSEAIKSRQKE